MEHRHLWIRSPAASGNSAPASRDHQSRPRFLRLNATSPDRSADPHAGRVRRTTTLFPVDYFEERRRISRSPASSTSKRRLWRSARIYSFGPTFRAEKSKTRRHLTEFWMVEPEVAYGTLDDIMEPRRRADHVPGRSVVSKNAAPTCRSSAVTLPSSKRSKRRFPRITYDEAVETPARKACQRRA